ncbi:MAG: S41 family peptidase, partial [Planctomycetota bacterium]
MRYPGRRLYQWVPPILASTILCCSLALVLGTRANAEDLQQTGDTSHITRYVAGVMGRQHISKMKLNDQQSERALQLYLKSLDPLKLYFLQSDVDEFDKYKYSIDDALKKGDLKIGIDIFKRFLTRVDERVKMANSLLDTQFDFTKMETIHVDADNRGYPQTSDEAMDRMRRQLKYSLLVLKYDGEEGPDAVEKLRRRYNRIGRRWKEETTTDTLLETFLSAMTMSYDPHTTYMSPDSFKDFLISLRLNLDGIGAALQEKDGETVVSNVIPGGAADKHGKLKVDDKIVSVGDGDNPNTDMVDIVEMPLSKVVKLIRGKAGTKVRLGVKPGGNGEVETYVITRARIELDEQGARSKIIDHTMPAGGGTVKLGYINLPSFYLDMDALRNRRSDYRSSTRDVRDILRNFKSQGVQAVVLDLSANGGGSLPEAVSMTGLFIDRGPVVQVKGYDNQVEVLDDRNRGTEWDGPLAVVTSKFSASASEILAGAIQDYERGIIIGDP